MLLTIDIGTSTFKSAFFDFNGNSLASVFIPLSIKSEGVKHEMEPSLWLNAFEECCKKLIEPDNQNNPSSGIMTHRLSDIQVIIISGNGPSLVPVFEEPSIENRLHVHAENARLWLDRRAVKYQEYVTEVMGGFVDACFFLPKVLYIKNNEEELYKRTKYFLGCPEYLAYALTGEARTVIPCEGFDRWFWNDDVLAKLNLDKEKFPLFIRPGDLFGTISLKVAQLYGFKKGIPVISGGPDFYAAILGSGVIEPGQACDRSGSSEGINLCTFNKVNDDRLMSYSHPIKPYWNLSGIINTTGKAIEWGCDLLGLKSINDFFLLAKESKPGSGGIIFHPYLAGERSPIWDASLKALWSGFSLSSGRSESANSILESIGFAIRDVISAMEEAGVDFRQLRVTGKLSCCNLLNQIKADITGKETLVCKCKEAELLGLAIIGSCSLNMYQSYAEASSVMVKIDEHFEPDIKNTVIYNNHFYEYQQRRK
ncbi:MAG: FGGY-family carbohydrate kinase [Treponema sp.]|nr:FGGY-family carbohydrate kinase [Treponema sp.]